MSGDEETLSCEAFGEFLLSQGVRSSVVTAVVDNRINSELFVGLEEEDLKEVAPAVGDRIKLRKILNEARKNSAQALSSTLDASSSSADVTTNLTIQTAAQILSNTLDESTSSSTAGVSTESSPIPTASPSPYSAVPVSTSNWHLNFTIPELGTFSDAVKDAVRTGVTTFKARKEIIQVLWTYITAYTFYPKPEQYTTVCTKLLQKYPKLCDKVDPDCNYGSWKLALRNSFKNFRKGCKRGLDKGEHSIESVAKCSRVENEEEVSNEEYDEAVQQLEEEYKKKFQKGGSRIQVK
ncbi:uncharacterized protein [Dysidea avara]|uniref:uncharacterized protein n=1 Tax=Dysidea avara TaxID=196820 RepID=UPI003330ADF4